MYYRRKTNVVKNNSKNSGQFQCKIKKYFEKLRHGPKHRLQKSLHNFSSSINVNILVFANY